MHIIIAGGGYAGILAAVRLANAGTGARITLVDARRAFVERTRLHEWVVGTAPLRRPYDELLEPHGVRFVCGRVTGLDGHRLELDDGRVLAWDQLVLTLGSQTAVPSLPGAERLQVLDRPDDRTRLATHAADGGAVTIVGGGLTGIELAAELAESTPARVELVDAHRVGACLSASAADYLRRRLHELGVHVREHERVDAVGEEGLWVWCAGMRGAPLLAELGLPTDPLGRVRVDPCLRVPGWDGLWAAGDAAAVEGRPWIRMSCASAMPMGGHVARNVAAVVDGRPPTPLAFGFLAQCISLGRSDGVFQLVDGRDRPTATWLGGRSAAWAKELILRMTTAVPVAEQRTGLPLYGWRQVA